MPGYVLDQGAIATCAHGGSAQPMLVTPRVKLTGQAAVLVAPYQIQGCPNPKPPPPGMLGPCVLANWSMAAMRVKSMGQPLLLSAGTGICVPTGVPLTFKKTQLRVKAL
jgi:hypothetical protein